MGKEILTPRDVPPLASELHFDEIANLKLPLAFLLCRLHNNLEARKYGVIVGDDNSGRIPGVVFSIAVNTLLHEKGISAIPTYFVPGSASEGAIKYMSAVINKQKTKNNQIGKNQKALLITEHIGLGHHVKNFQRAFYENNILFDIGAVWSSEDEEGYRKAGAIDEKTNLYRGNVNQAYNKVPLFNDFPHTGLHDEKFSGEKFITVKNVVARDNARLALRDARHIAEELVVFYRDRYYSDNQQ